MKQILSGNLDEQTAHHPETRGWFIGSFMENFPEFQNDKVEVKWIRHEKGFHKPGSNSETSLKNITILISGKFCVTFPESSTEVILENTGDYVFFDVSSQGHFGDALEDSLLLVVRYRH